VLVLSNYVRDQLIRSGLPENQVTVLPPWVDLPTESDTGDDDRILFAGRLNRDKGLPKLLQALSLINRPFKAIIAGDGPQRGESEQLASKLGLERRVEFVGWLTKDEIRMQFARCSFLVFPSLLAEPFGLVGPEAMAHGKPVVAFDGGGVTEWLLNGVNGILVRTGDTAGLATAIQQLLSSPNLRTILGRAARNLVIERFDQRVVLPKLMQIYHAAVNS